MTVKRVLVAEDNEDHLFLTVRALRDVEGVHLEVETVRDGAEALEHVFGRQGEPESARALPHLILLDLKMPKVDGFQVLERLKSHERLRTIPIVVLTASDRVEDIQETYRLCGNSYVTKPANAASMREGLAGITHYWTGLSALPDPS